MNESSPYFSVVMATLNAEKCIENSLISLGSQTLKDWELVVVDGGSTDNTVKILESAGIKNIKLLQGADSGIYDAMNKGISQARGAWVYFLNAGDCFASINVLESIQTHSLAHTDADIVYGDIRVFNSKNRSTIKRQLIKSMRDFYDGIPLCHQSVFYSRGSFDKFGGYSSSLKICGDYEHMIRLKIAGCHFSKCEIVVANYQYGGFSHRSLRKLQEERVKIASEYFPMWHKFKLWIKIPFLVLKSCVIQLLGTIKSKENR